MHGSNVIGKKTLMKVTILLSSLYNCHDIKTVKYVICKFQNQYIFDYIHFTPISKDPNTSTEYQLLYNHETYLVIVTACWS